ncbi:glyoxalase/Bleomycin resistance /Dioxygenase superfamily protein [Pseudarthrobacter siccitolerans]|uniref:Glyoxalase/Bleomycin resistance /Dioxygenase superfamily protein n=1 Tax=Pseudarthrobacter siccitolerans TaxID=861266 RepID=A0A024H2M9_9MICC|nr:VOC family protein [Pseudarthrobacter siccitolerans]CCQ46283.1 glyoxalase/Bleomycin resistance /Dioxygenase superfamily protein [Pseudarthrobacter siccitolerans]
MRVIQVAQHAEDLQRAAEFYSWLLGVGPTAVFDPPGLLFFDLDGIRLLLERGAPRALLYLEVPDVRELAEQLQGRGVEVVAEPHVIFSHSDALLGPQGTDEWMAFIKDSEGNTVGLVSQLPALPPPMTPGA